MERSYWESKWNKNDIGFHQAEINTHLQKFYPKLGLQKGDTVLVPLCGKTQDMCWLADQGLKVVGVELSEKAVQEFFEENKIEFKREGNLFISGNITIICQDIFKAKLDQYSFKAIFDRAATVALPKRMRSSYLELLRNQMPNPNTLMIIFQYDQSLVDGPPFSVEVSEVKEVFSSLEVLERTSLESRPPKFKDVPRFEITCLHLK